MTKAKGLPKEVHGDEDSVNTPASYEHYHGMNDTLPIGSDALRLALSEQYQAVNALLTGDTPNLYVIDAKKRLDEIGVEIDQYERVKDPDAREEIYQEITELLSNTLRYIALSEKIATDDTAKASMGVRSLADTKGTTLIMPSGWDDPAKPLH